MLLTLKKILYRRNLTKHRFFILKGCSCPEETLLIERGIRLVDCPTKADFIIATGTVNRQMSDSIIEYMMRHQKIRGVAVWGACFFNPAGSLDSIKDFCSSGRFFFQSMGCPPSASEFVRDLTEALSQ